MDTGPAVRSISAEYRGEETIESQEKRTVISPIARRIFLMAGASAAWAQKSPSGNAGFDGLDKNRDGYLSKEEVAGDKEMAKRVARDAGIPIVPYVSLKHEVWKKEKQKFANTIGEQLGYPVFVKPANLGSSVGVHKVKEPGGLSAALEDAFTYDGKVVVEAAVNAREIEVAVLENPDAGADPLVSIPGEIDPAHEFYSYEAKYLDEKGAALIIPAKLDPEETKRAQEIGRKVFTALECEGMARVDLFLDRSSGEFFFNELNTIPGFTSISMYPKLWEVTGIGYQELLSKLVDLAISRHEKKKTLVREFRLEK
jgi:D-alanine-D-alanine ligase